MFGPASNSTHVSATTHVKHYHQVRFFVFFLFVEVDVQKINAYYYHAISGRQHERQINKFSSHILACQLKYGESTFANLQSKLMWVL